MEPFTEDITASIASLGEKELIRRIRVWLGASAPATPTGMGDDCAVLPDAAGPKRLITTDSVVLNRHFEATCPAGHAGSKLLRRNLSDIAAMGGSPEAAVLAGFLPRRLRIDWLQAFIEGLAQTALEFGIPIVGGDLTETSQDLAFNLTLLGHAENPLLRQGGASGDWICLTGPVGGSQSGRHLSFTPRLREGNLLGESQSVRACIDISDGLAIDLAAIVPPSCSASLDLLAIPVHSDAQQLARSSGRTPIWHALNDGEDHELLFIFRSEKEADWETLCSTFSEAGCAVPVKIGILVPRGSAPVLDAFTQRPPEHLSGYDHFR